MARRRKRGTGRKYFTQEHEDAIIQYNKSTDFLERSHLYEYMIRPAFDEMVDKIVYTYRFNTLPNCDELRDDCKVWLTTILEKYNPDKGSKAFSYFSVITKNWFIAQVKKQQKKQKRELSLSDYISADKIGNTPLYADDEYHQNQETREFLDLLQKEIQSWNSDSMRPNEKKVYEAIKLIFENADKLEIFNKKAIYLYLREITGLNTKQIVAQLNKMRARYRTFKDDYDNGIV